MSGAGAGFAAAGGVIGAIGAYQQGQAEGNLNDLNAGVDRKKARDVLLQGRYTAQQIREQVAGILGGQSVGYAGQNVALDSGAPADVASDTARLAALDIATALGNAARQAYGFKVEAASSSYQAKYARYAGNLAAIGQLLGAGASAAAAG